MLKFLEAYFSKVLSCEYLEGRVEQMRGFLINKNLCVYYWLRKRIGRKQAYRVSNTLEKVILIFGREPIL